MKKTLSLLCITLLAATAQADVTYTFNGKTETWDGSTPIFTNAFAGVKCPWSGNVTEVSNGSVSGEYNYVWGVFSQQGDVTNNSVTVENVLGLKEVTATKATYGGASGNTVTIINSEVQLVCGAYVDSTTTGVTNNTVILQGTNNKIGQVYGGLGYDGTGVNLYGDLTTGNQLKLVDFAGSLTSIDHFDSLSFELTSWQNAATVLELGNVFSSFGNKGLSITLDLSNCDLSEAEGAMTLFTNFGGTSSDIAGFTLIGADDIELTVQDGAVVASFSASDAVPEPSTATLSLLALAALAARRRRK